MATRAYCCVCKGRITDNQPARINSVTQATAHEQCLSERAVKCDRPVREHKTPFVCEHQKPTTYDMLNESPVFKALMNIPTTPETRHLWDIQKVPVYANEIQTSWDFQASCVFCGVGFNLSDLEDAHPLYEASVKCLLIGPCEKRK